MRRNLLNESMRRKGHAVVGVLSVLSAGATGASAQTCEEGMWMQVTPAVSPSDGAGVMAYDPVRQVAVANLERRENHEQVFRTWEWDGENWSLRASGAGIPWGAMAFDTVRGYTLLVGGGTWSWDGTAWTRLSEFSPPFYVATPTGLAFDSDRGVAVLYAAGYDRNTWEWDGSNWTLVSTLGPDDNLELDGPPGQRGFSICYDSNVQRTIMFGGVDYYAFNETWAWDGAEWTFVEFGPQARHDASMAFDSARNRRVLFGGWDIGPGGRFIVFGDTWESGAGMEWTLVDTTGPQERAVAAMAYDAARNNIVLFGGYPQGFFNDTWIRTQRQVNGGPSIVTQPMNTEVVVSGVASFQVEASGEGTITYQWRKDGHALQNSARVLGALTNVLTITGVTSADEGSYDVVVSNPCESITSDAATLDVVGVCPADFNADAIVNSQDFFDYLTAFFASAPAADFDGSGTVSSGDFFAYLDVFFAGCV